MTHESPDTVPDEKRGAVLNLTLTLDRPVMDVDDKPVRLRPGMSRTAEVKTGQRRVIEYLPSPVHRAGSLRNEEALIAQNLARGTEKHAYRPQ